ncbi:FAD-binding oxidoreductase [Nocardia sp. NBC_00416]|uniref:FAD-binding oxidoreductase n=1 Tax=Nocardia sp. NBC_00416 TaxID=2975991 RepID=UPI002E1F5404
MIDLLDRLLPGKVSRRAADLEAHSRDETGRSRRRPAAVVYAAHTDDVRTTLNWAAEAGHPVIAFGAGTSAEGHIVPLGDEIVLDMSGLNGVLSVRPNDFLATVQPGLTRTALNKAVADTGLFFPVDPGADASIGGMAATNASGTTTVRYGGIRANVAALEVVLPNGDLVRLGRGVRKTSSGYDLKDLFIGSAGTLGVFTELTVTLHPVPQHVHAQRVFFPTVEQAVAAAYQIMAVALPVARLELVDASSMRAINQYLGTAHPERPALFVELHSSSAAAIDAEAKEIDTIAYDNGAIQVEAAHQQAERNEIWRARHALFFAIKALYPGCQYHITDTAVPISQVPEMVRITEESAASLGLEIVIAGHVADGNVHTVVPVTPDNAERAYTFSDRLVEHALAVGGTATGEHGIGVAKKKYLRTEHGGAVEVMAAIKTALDPRGLLNPGKILDVTGVGDGHRARAEFR